MTAIAYGNVLRIVNVPTPAIECRNGGTDDEAVGEGVVGRLVGIAMDKAIGAGLAPYELKALAELLLVAAITEGAVESLALGAFHLLYEQTGFTHGLS